MVADHGPDKCHISYSQDSAKLHLVHKAVHSVNLTTRHSLRLLFFYSYIALHIVDQLLGAGYTYVAPPS